MYRKIMSYILIFAIVFIPVFASKTYATGDPMSAHGYQITIWKYSGSGSPIQVGKPILVYHPDLFGDVFRHNSVSIPGSYGGLLSQNWGLSQIVDKENDWHDQDDYLVDNLTSNPNTSGLNNTYVDENGNEITTSGNYYYTADSSQCSAIKYDNLSSKNPESGTNGYFYFDFKYQSKDRKITYKGSDVDTSQYYKIYSDSNLTEYNINNNNYLDNLIKNKYFKSIQSIKTYFGIDIEYKDMDKYYVSVEPVQRVLDGIIRLTGSYLIKTLPYEQKKPDSWTSSDWIKYEHGPTYACACGTKNCGGGCRVENELGTGCLESYPKRDCMNCSCNDEYYTYSLPVQYCGIKQRHYIYGKYAEGASHIQTSRSLGSSTYFLNRAVNYCANDDNKHCELENDNITCKKDSSGNIIYQYYIGPNLEEALVGTVASNYYLLNGSCVPSGTQGSSPTGIKHYYLEDLISCQDTCSSITDKKSDEYLKCAENYCDASVDFNLKGNARIRKKDCIISCGYTYGKDPTPDDGINNSESVNSCNNSNPYINLIQLGKTLPVKTTSTCSTDNNTLENLEETTGVRVTCDGDQITDFDGDDTNDRVFDQRDYINVACKEISGFGFVDLSNKILVSGQGIDYWAKLNGEKECVAYFNLEQWKFDYATISSKDPDRRKRLLYIYTVFNNELNESYDKESNPYYDADFESENDGEVNWSSYEYDTSKVSVVTRVNEIVNNESIRTGDYNLSIQAEENSVNATVVNKDNLTQIYSMNKNTFVVNRYMQTSKVKAYYKFGKYCVTNDGLATVYDAPENGVCYVSNAENVLGKNVYYTNLNATENSNFSDEVKGSIYGEDGHYVFSDVSVGTETIDSEKYYEDGETCEYQIDGNGLSCAIVIKSKDGTVMHGNSIYVYGGVTATLKVSEKLESDDGVNNYGIVKGTVAELNGNKNIDIDIFDKKNGVEEIYVTGVVESKTEGISVTCNRKIYIIDPHDECGVSCGIEKYQGNELVYEILSPEPGNTRQTQKPVKYETAMSTNMKWREVLPSVTDGKYIVRLSKPLGNSYNENGNLEYNDTILYAKVKGTMMNTGAACYNVCWTDPPNLPNCVDTYKAAETKEIKNHCELYWNSDINDYESVDDCVFQCSTNRLCPDDRRNLSEIEKYCKNNYGELGFDKAVNCVNYCYYCPECSSDYLYRQVNNYNPFPNSSDSNTLGYNYPTGNRIIGSNWVGKSGYIKADDDDTTSVTGAYANQNVEYVIELTPNDIERIRQDTESYNAATEGNDAYLDYVYMDNVDTSQRYYSKFINETFRANFKMINGQAVG